MMIIMDDDEQNRLEQADRRGAYDNRINYNSESATQSCSVVFMQYLVRVLLLVVSSSRITTTTTGTRLLNQQ